MSLQNISMQIRNIITYVIREVSSCWQELLSRTFLLILLQLIQVITLITLKCKLTLDNPADLIGVDTTYRKGIHHNDAPH